MTTAEDLPETWCRMWSEDPSLAHDLLTDDARQWASRTEGLDTVVGPAETEAFVAAYAVRVGNRFRPRTPVIGAGLVAYTWDVTLRDGSVKSGADVNVLAGDRVAENWTFVADGLDERPDETGGGTIADLGAVVAAEAERRGVRVHREPVLDLRRKTAAYLWEPASGGPGGVDVLVVRDGAVVQTSSVVATRAFAY